MDKIPEIKAEFLFEFKNKQEWINEAQSRFDPYRSKAIKTICLDKYGYCLTTGKDFADAEIIGTYPVKVYKLQNVSDLVTKLVNDIFTIDEDAEIETSSLITVEWLMQLHPELDPEQAEEYRRFCRSKTIVFKECYGDGSIMWPKYQEFLKAKG